MYDSIGVSLYRLALSRVHNSRSYIKEKFHDFIYYSPVNSDLYYFMGYSTKDRITLTKHEPIISLFYRMLLKKDFQKMKKKVPLHKIGLFIIKLKIIKKKLIKKVKYIERHNF